MRLINVRYVTHFIAWISKALNILHIIKEKAVIFNLIEENSVY
jgi:hypothetical protein